MATRQRLVLVYNPRSSGYSQVEREVIEPLRQIPNLTVLKYAIKPTNVDDNATHLSALLRDHDLVLATGGDGTATIALNGVVLAGVATKLAVLGYGNFNDFARSLGGYDFDFVAQHFFAEQPPTRKLYPLDIQVDGEHWRYAASYLTVGLFAESTRVFDQPDVRQFLQKHGQNLFFSLWVLARWYFQNRRREFIPAAKLNGKTLPTDTTDLMAVNGKTVAKLMRGGGFWTRQSQFWLSTARLGSFWRLLGFMARSVTHRLPGHATAKLHLEFVEPASIELQAEGEYQKFTGIKTLTVSKAPAVECLVAK